MPAFLPAPAARLLAATSLLIGLCSSLLAPGVSAQDSAQAPTTPTQDSPSPHPGQTVYETFCALCHNGTDPRAASLTTLQAMTAESLHFTLTQGIMSAQGRSLSIDQRTAVIDFLAADRIGDEWLTAKLCSEADARVSFSDVALPAAGVDKRFSRQLSAAQAGLNKTDLAEGLELAWAFGIPGVSGLRSAPAIAGSTLFYPAGASGRVLALDANTGCLKWAYDAGAPLRSSATLAEPLANGIHPLIVTDEEARVHAIDASNGNRLWLVSGAVDVDVATRLTGAPLSYQQQIIIPVSASGVTRGADPLYECCDGRGAIISLDASTGDRRWTWYTMPAAEYTGKLNSVGTRLKGPSGAPVWASPSLDEKRGYLYVTTGENTSLPATDTSNAIVALNIATGEQVWRFQAVADDVWNTACGGRTHGPNCPDASESIIKDWDFGGAAIPVTLADGSEVLVAGQKSGHLWALNPDDGSVIWQQRVGNGSALGGNHWGVAVDGSRVFMTINDPHYATLTDDMINAGVYAFDLASGEALWEFRAAPDCSNGRQALVETCQEKYGFSAMPLVIDGAVVAGNIDGRLFIFDAADGSVLFRFDTSQPFQTVNGIAARGGSIDAHSVAAGAGMLFIGSGYERFRQQNGNVLLAFRPRQSQ